MAGTAGIVTLKDLVARLLGDVGDEYAAANQEVRTLTDGTIVADGLALVEDVNSQLGTHFDASEVDSLGGLVFSELGRRPVVGDEVELGRRLQGPRGAPRRPAHREGPPAAAAKVDQRERPRPPTVQTGARTRGITDHD